jgi:hypothetical protein
VKFPTILLLAFVLLANHSIWCQVRIGHNSVKGIVTDAEGGSPLPLVNVFLQGTTRGTSSQIDGKFVLADLPDGEFDLVLSLVGYVRETRHLSFTNGVQLEINAQLKPRQITLSQVEITGSAGAWKQLLPIFTREFLGETENSMKCTIVNPTVLSLSIAPSGDTLIAYTDSTLVIENDALGYRVYVQLERFAFVSKTSWMYMRYYPRYEERLPLDETQSKQWRERRATCYEFSFRHFLTTTLQRRLEFSNFIVSTGNLNDLYRGVGSPIDGINIAIVANRDFSSYEIDFSADDIRVDQREQFRSEKTPVQARSSFSSVVSIKHRPILTDKNGNLVQPLSVAFDGFWSTRRLADRLPFDYQPEKE